MVGILTFHKAINYGAVLQAYALRTAVESLGKPSSVVNYVGGKMLAESKVFFFPKRAALVDQLLRCYRLPMRAATIKRFNRFLKDELQLSHVNVIGEEGLVASADQFSAFISGSDQVFNYVGTGEDFNYYLEFAQGGTKRIAYAPSFGLRRVDEEHAPRVTAALNRFHALSVREDVGADIVEELTGQRPQRVCDPTFLLDKKQWEQLCVAPALKKPYVLVYSFGSRHLEAVAGDLAGQIGGVVVNINRSLPGVVGAGKVKNAYAPGPREFLGLIRDAEIVVTNSFHGMALSVLLEKEFYVFTNHYENANATNQRFVTLAESLGLSQRVHDTVEHVRRSPVDYAQVREKVERWREESVEFLSCALQDI